MSFSKNMPGRPWQDRPEPHRFDEFPAGYSLVGCAPAEPASASPAGGHLPTKGRGSTIELQRTANYLLTACLTPGDNPNPFRAGSWVPSECKDSHRFAVAEMMQREVMEHESG